MKLRKRKPIYLYLYLYLALWLAFPCVNVCIWMADCTLLLGTTGTAFLLQRVLNWGAAACGLYLAVGHYRKGEKAARDQVLLVLAAGAMALILFCWNFLCAFLDGMEEYHSFSSPDGAHTIVIMEKIDGISGQVALYERVSPFLVYPRERIITNNGYRPVCAGEYSLAWEGDTVTLSASDGAGENRAISVLLHEG